MRKEDTTIQSKKEFFEGRAVVAGTIIVTAFLCFFTIFEITAIKLEWNIPFMNVFLEGADSMLFTYYREEEDKLELSLENEIGNPDVDTGPVEEATETECQLPNMQEYANATDENVSASEGKNNVSLEENTNSLRGDKIEQVPETEQKIEQDTQVTELTEDTERAESITEKKEHLPFYIKINRQQNVVTVYGADEKGEYTIPVKAILCSTGLYNATPTGTFRLSTKYVWRELHGGVYGQYASRITGGILFHSVPYSSKNKASLYWDKYNKLGQQASMGCVRLTVGDAKWIYDNCPSGTKVEIYDSKDPGPLGKPVALKLDKDSANKGWDPTDPDVRNPWHEWSLDE